VDAGGCTPRNTGCRAAAAAAAGLTLTDLRASASPIFRRVHDLLHRVAGAFAGDVGVVGRNSLVPRLRSIAGDIDRIAACECPCVKRIVFLPVTRLKRMKLAQYILNLTCRTIAVLICLLACSIYRTQNVICSKCNFFSYWYFIPKLFSPPDTWLRLLILDLFL